MAQSEVQRAPIAAASSGDNTLVAAVTGKKIRVLSLTLIAAAAVSIRFESGAGGTALTGVMALVTPFVFKLEHNGSGHFETAEGALLNLELSAAVACAGWLNYVEAS